MSYNKNKVKSCLNKAEKELKETNKHRGLIKVKINSELIQNHVTKAEHNLNAIIDFKKIGYSDWSASAAFYSIYHCILAILNKFGYESRNQECSFALIYQLIKDKKINLNKELIEEIYLINVEEKHEFPTIINIRETEQYGISLSLENQTLKKLLNISQVILDQTKVIIES